jgi:hypothetical protein
MQQAVELEYQYAEDTMPARRIGIECRHVQRIPAFYCQPPLPANRPG